jgi:hypothetical protein
MEYRPVLVGPSTLTKYVELFTDCFPKAPLFTVDYLYWLYCRNPEGSVVGYDAWDGERLAAHYACIPTRNYVNGRAVRSLLSINSATYRDYQGQGLFTKLAQLTFQTGGENGFDCVYGVANTNSTDAFERKLGFQLVQPLDALIGFGELGVDWRNVSRNAQFDRIWTSETLRWRQQNPRNPITAELLNEKVVFTARAAPLVQAYAEIDSTRISNPYRRIDSSASHLRVWIGAIPKGTANFGGYVNLPRPLRPSPLNFIYLPISTERSKIDPGSLHINFLDFDAF